MITYETSSLTPELVLDVFVALYLVGLVLLNVWWRRRAKKH